MSHQAPHYRTSPNGTRFVAGRKRWTNLKRHKPNLVSVHWEDDSEKLQSQFFNDMDEARRFRKKIRGDL